MPIKQRDVQLLRRPFGTLLPDKQVTKHKVAFILKGCEQVIAVGDATTERLLRFGIIPDVAVIDGIERRSKRDYPANYQAKEFHCTNPAGTISQDAMIVLKEALKTSPPVRVLVDGEEDMLALPIFAMAREGTSVLYGQPLEGLVVVKITRTKQRQAKDFMHRICDNTDLITSSSNDSNVNVSRNRPGKSNRNRNRNTKTNG